MARGEDTSKHPNRGVGAGSYWDNLLKGSLINPIQAQSQAWLDSPDNAPYLNTEVATFSPETLKEFGLDKDKD